MDRVLCDAAGNPLLMTTELVLLDGVTPTVPFGTVAEVRSRSGEATWQWTFACTENTDDAQQRVIELASLPLEERTGRAVRLDQGGRR